jgi:uracil-DNA glycosylase
MITSFFKIKPKSDGVLGKRPRAEEDETNDVTQVIRTKTETTLCPKVQELVGHLESTEHDGSTTWYDALRSYTSSRDFQSLATFVAAQRELAPTSNQGRGAIYPPPHEVFSSLHLTPIHKVKVVIVGQDPYHQYNQGHGLAFSVKRGVKIPPSLRNIYKELVDDPSVTSFTSMPNHGCLERWAEQGVLLLNSVLTVRDSEPNSHANRGWEKFTSAIIQALDEFCEVNNKGLVFLLWGNPASKKAEGAIRTKRRHTIICTSHPSPLGATKTNTPFLGSRCFSKANEALIKMGLDPIIWNIEG